MIMTDWFTSQKVEDILGIPSGKYSNSASTGCAKAGNDIQMPGCKKNVEDLIRAVESGEPADGYTVTLADLQFCAANVIRAALRTM
jgi:beta-glucosidase